MSFTDWVRESKDRFKTEPPAAAARESTQAFARGAFRRMGRYMGRPIWQHGDWDVLVVLDACRTDLWDSVAPEYNLPTGGSVWSNASCSIDWINRNFNGYPEQAGQTGYVTANPFSHHYTDKCKSANLGDGRVGYFAPLYRTHWQEIPPDGEPDMDGIMTVPPEPITDFGIEAWRNRNGLGIDRLVLHYLPPHEPYKTRPEWGNGNHRLFDNMITDGEKSAGASIWPAVREGDIPMDEFWEVYQDNLRWALDDVVGRLLCNLDADVAITADHGNALGEWGEWHHPPGAIGPAVRKVPWAEVRATDGGSVTPDVDLHEPAAAASQDMSTVEQLEALGYR